MKKILVLGAGHSAPYLIHHLLSAAESLDAQVTVADRDIAAAERRVDSHSRGLAIAFDIFDEGARRREIPDADVVVHLLPPPFQHLIASECVAHGVHMVSASYRAREVEALDEEARRRDVTLLCEVGLDPGIDVMAAQRLIDRVRSEGGRVERFCSYGGGLPEPDAGANPLDYCITWNPRNVVMAAVGGACYLRKGDIHFVPWERMFSAYWPVRVPGLGELEAYANRDSFAYRDVHGITAAQTVVRGTLRYPGFCDLWRQIVQLGLPNEDLVIPVPAEHTWRELVAMCLPDRHILADVPGADLSEDDVRGRVAAFLELDPDGEVMGKLEWLGLFSDEPVGGDTPAAALVALLEEKLPLPEGARDLVVLHHELDAHYPSEDRRERFLSTFLHYGNPGGFTAMAQGVGLPAATAVKLILEDRITARGALIPTASEIYGPILDELEGEGFIWNETTENLETPSFGT